MEPEIHRLRFLRVLQIALVASLVASPALAVASAFFPVSQHAITAALWIAGTVLVTCFAITAQRLAAGLGDSSAMSPGAVIALTLIPCVSVVGVPVVLIDVAKGYARLTGDDSLVRRTAVAAILYPVLSMGAGFFVTMFMVAVIGAHFADLGATGSALALALPSLFAQACLAAATYFIAAAARDAVDMRRDLGATGGNAPAAVSA